MTARYLVVDGHSVIFQSALLRELHQRRGGQARDELVNRLQALQDSSHWLVTVVFDGTQAVADRSGQNRRHFTRRQASSASIVVAYALAHETADQVIERLVAASGKAGDIVVVTADHAEQATVMAMGATAQSPDWLWSEMQAHEAALQNRLRSQNARNSNFILL
jgi:predicted RNA-binding protein with PIN domain